MSRRGKPMTRRFFVVVVCALLIVPTSAASTDQDDKLQNRYSFCINKADAEFLEEFRGYCDALCIRKQRGHEYECLALHMKWHTGICTLPTSETDIENQHLEKAKDRCLREFMAGITALP